MSRLLALLLLLTLPAWADTEVRRLQNDSDASVQLHLGQAQLGSFDRFGEGAVHFILPTSAEGALEIKTRLGLTRLYESNGLIYAVVNGAAPQAISNRANQYLTLFVDTQGNVRVRRWEYWYG